MTRSADPEHGDMACGALSGPRCSCMPDKTGKASLQSVVTICGFHLQQQDSINVEVNMLSAYRARHLHTMVTACWGQSWVRTHSIAVWLRRPELYQYAVELQTYLAA